MSHYGVRIISVDFYMAAPIQGLDVTYSEFRGSSISLVPIIRIFGTTDAGKKICLHVHGVFPYFYIPYDGVEDLNSLMYQIAANLDKAINISLGQTSSTAQHVYKISLVSGIPFYGYHYREHQFLKICFYNPLIIKKATNLLQNDSVLGKLYQPHEAHIPFTLQFMIDYNLHGMSKIYLNDLKFRVNPDDRANSNIPAELMLPESITKNSCSELECDTLSENIMNHLDLLEGKMTANPGIQALWEDEKQRRRLKGDESQIGPCLTLENTQVPPTKSHEIFKQALLNRLAVLEDDTLSTQMNTSVYPAETPQGNSFLDASFVDSHTPTPENLNQSLDFNKTLDGDVQELFEALKELGDKEEEKEEDSILSQMNDEEDDYFDLSLPLEVKSPVKMDVDEDLDTTLVPQLDGAHDCDDEDYVESSNSSSDELNVTIKSQPVKSVKKSASKYKELPITVSPRKSRSTSKDKFRISEEKLSFAQNFAVKTKAKEVSNMEVVKRKLEFNATMSKTVIEENIECEYRAESKPNLVNLSNIADCTNLTSAEMYDLEKNYIPKEGTSKNLSQTSSLIQSQPKPLSQNSTDSSLLHDYLPSVQKISPSEESSEDIQVWQNPNNNKHESNSQSSNDLFDKSSTENLVKTSQSSSTFDNISKYLTPKKKAPTRHEVLKTMEMLHIPKIIHRKPFYSKVNDLTSSIEVGSTVLKIPSTTTIDLEDFKSIYDGIDHVRKLILPPDIKFNYESIKKMKLSFCSNANCVMTPLRCPPSRKEVLKWVKNNLDSTLPVVKEKVEKKRIFLPTSPNRMDESDLEISLTVSPVEDEEEEKSAPLSPVLGKASKKRKKYQKKSKNQSGLSGVTLNNTYGFSMTPENYQKVKTIQDHQFLTVLVVELHFLTRGTFKPDPNYDPIRAIFYSIFVDSPDNSNETGIIAVNTLKNNQKFLINNVENIIYVENEKGLFEEFIKLMSKVNPDICTGYEIELLSWGYLIERANILEINLTQILSRTKDKIRYNEEDKALRLTGRIILDFWRLLRHEIALQSYTFENIAYHILHRRLPNFSFKDLTFWWEHPSSIYRYRTVEYYIIRVEGILRIMAQLDLIGRTSELARLFGIQFYEVLSRGSQFRVESMMLRLAKPLNFIPVSPSAQQRGNMKAPEFLSLILEPESKMYVDPVIVLDFQSLYPSLIIAYNYCFSTCIGRVQHLGRNSIFEFGATQYRIPRKRVEKLVRKDDLNFAPCGVAFVKKRIRDGILPRMLREILDTRLMVKKSMKENKGDSLLQKVLHNRQLGLKLIANVTYGYTAANFSGRMPSVELGDSVVSKGRETLQRAIAMVENTPEWGAKVVYGDTDSLFVCTPGKTRSEAFEIGKKIADAVTNDNPDPVKLKLEKVYQPCILQTKKRYVGYMYESPDQKEPEYNAKGIETVRRDGCPAVAKMLEKCIRILFETQDVSQVKEYVLSQFQKMITGKISLQDLTFAKEYRGASGYRPGACVPALELARRWTAVDKRNEPRSSQRVPYIIVNGPPGLPLIRLVRSPYDFITDPSLKPNVQYYITKVIIPPINRCIKLIGGDLNYWYNQMPRKYQSMITSGGSPGKKNTISQYFASTDCVCCGRQTQFGICDICQERPKETIVTLMDKMRIWEKTNHEVNLICQSCSGLSNTSPCISLDCPVFYKRNQSSRKLQQTTVIRDLLKLPQYQF